MEIYVDASEVHQLADEMRHHASTTRGLTRNAVRKTGHDCLAIMQVKTPVDTGFLRSSESVDFTELGFEAGPTAEYGAPVELGVPHPFVINARPGGFLHFVIDGKDVFAKRVVHPPMAPQPYAAPAFDAVLPVFEEALGVIGEMAVAP